MFYADNREETCSFRESSYRERAKVMEEDEELPKARVYVGLERMRELLGVLERLEEEVEHNKEEEEEEEEEQQQE